MPMKLENNSNSLLTRGPIGISEPTDKEFELFRKLVLKELGLEWNKDKKYLLHARLQRRLQFHKFKTFGEYYDFIEYKENSDERQHFFDAVTTTKSGFYREKQHFDYLRQKVFPELKELRLQKRQKLRFWSAGCSCGEEVFTLAIEAHNLIGADLIAGGGLRILGSDVNLNVLKIAMRGEFTAEQVSPVSGEFLERYFEPVQDMNKGCHCLKMDIRQIIQFRHFNLLSSEYPIATKFQLIFCRNVLYYLHPEKRDFLLSNLVDHLKEGGWLVLGITESGYPLDGMKKEAFSIYRKT